jgi:hypothetical protein
MRSSVRPNERMPCKVTLVFLLLLSMLQSMQCMVWQGQAKNVGRWEYLANFAYAVSRFDANFNSFANFAVLGHQVDVFSLSADLRLALLCCLHFAERIWQL